MLCLFGPPAVRLGDVSTPLNLRPKAVALLVRVVLDGPNSRAELAELIFGEAEDPRATLRWHLNYLRAQLPESLRKYLLVTPDRIAFDAPTDVKAFRYGAKRLLEQPNDPEIANVLSLYRGDLCAGLTVSASAVFDTWLYVEQEGLRRLFRQASLRKSDSLAALTNVPCLTLIVQATRPWPEGRPYLTGRHHRRPAEGCSPCSAVRRPPIRSPHAGP